VNFIWPQSARSELRAVESEDAMRILLALTRYVESGEGDIKRCPAIGMDTTGCESETSGSFSGSYRKSWLSCVFDIGPTFTDRNGERISTRMKRRGHVSGPLSSIAVSTGICLRSGCSASRQPVKLHCFRLAGLADGVACFGCRRYSPYCPPGSDLEPRRGIIRPDRH
jgi:hypothetical protein